MNRCLKKNLSAKLNGLLALGLLAVSAPAAQPAALPVNLPLFFEASQVLAASPAQFIARGHDYQFLISPAETQIMLRKTAGTVAAVRMQFAGASAQAQITGDTEMPGKINHLNGNDPAKWRTGLAMFAKVRVDELYPGVNLVYYGNQQQLEYDFTVAPGAKPDAIAIHFDGVDKVSISKPGELILTLGDAEIRQPKPVIYQMVGDARHEINGGYRLVDARTVAFAVGQYDKTLPLVIDPILSYSTYFGGTADETAWTVAADTNGFVYFAGQTLSKQIDANSIFATAGAFQTNFAGGTALGDAFVAKLDNLATYPVYLTYLGGSADDVVHGLAVDTAGNAYVAGYTDSPNFPTTNSLYKTISGTVNPGVGYYPLDAFVAELNPGGSNLIYSTYLGGSEADGAYGIAVDSAGNAYVTGVTFSTNFPATNAIHYRLAGKTNTVLDHLACTNSVYYNANAFIAKIGSGGTNLVYSSYFGGNNYDFGRSIAVDSSNCVYVTGFTASTNFPATNAVVQQLVSTNGVGTNQVIITNTIWNGSLLNGSTNHSSSYDAFVAKFDSTGTNLIYSTYLGGTNNDEAYSIAVDSQGAAYVAGWTTSTNFPNTAVDSLYSGLLNSPVGSLVTNVFLTKITNNVTTNGTFAGIACSTVFGGSSVDIGYGVALSAAADFVFVAGSASSTNFPAFSVPGLMRMTNSGGSDAFVAAFETSAFIPVYSVCLGGTRDDFGYGIAVDSANNVYIVGQTFSADFLTYQAPFTTRNGPSDAFLARIMWFVPAPGIATQPVGQTNEVGKSITLSVGVDQAGTPPFFYQWQFDGTTLTNGGNISGAASATLIINPAQTNNSGDYSVIVTNYGGSVTSSNATLWITNVPPMITVQPPTNQLLGVGATAKFTVTAIGTAPLSYQWMVGGANLVNGTNLPPGGYNISGATSNVLTISNLQTNNSATNYSVIITNITGIANAAISSNAALTVQWFPLITVQPTNQWIAVGSNTVFIVNAVGGVPLSYHWQMNGTNLPPGGNGGNNISGATTNNSLIITNAQTVNSNNYFSVIVTNRAGSVTSSPPAYLYVTNIPPAITTQPLSQTNGAGTPVTLFVTATGTAPLRYQWQRFGTNLLNGTNYFNNSTTNASLTIKNVQTNDGGDYTVVVTGPGGSTNSSVAILTVQLSPLIIVQPTPTNQAVEAGSTVIYTVTAIGTVPLSYQWQVNGTNLMNVTNRISGATTNRLVITPTQTPDSTNSYSVIVTNVVGSATSSVVILTVTNILPVITTQPTNQAVVVTSNVTFVVTATGTPLLSYQWQVNGTSLTNGSGISGATSNQLTITASQLTNSGNYTVIVTNYGGVATSSNASLIVASSPVILTQPTNQSMAVGASATNVVIAIGTVPLSYQWWVNGTNKLVNGTNSVNGTNVITRGATNNVLIISPAQTNNSGFYTVVITNRAGSVTSSPTAFLNITNIPPTITTQPLSQTNGGGTAVTLFVTATGTAPLSYQWQLFGTNLLNGTNYLNGTTNASLTIKNVQPNDGGDYTVVVTNYGGVATSSNATLTVQLSPLIIVQPTPTNQAMEAGPTVTYAVTAIGTVPLSYQWQVNGTSLTNGNGISGAATNRLSINTAQTANSTNSYSVIVTNVVGSATSSVVLLTVTNIPPVITTQPTNQAVVLTSNVTFVVTATGTAPLNYQWQVNGTNLANVTGHISGATTNVLKISAAQTTNSGNYTVIVTNYGGMVTSSVASLIVASSPVILTQPTNQAVVVGANVTNVVIAIGTAPLSYQWWNGTNKLVNGTNSVNGTNVITRGATNNVLAINNAQLTNSGNYTVVVTNLVGSATSSNAVLTVGIPPAITVQPTNQAVAGGSSVTLAVTATGTSPLSYQWQLNQTNLVDGGQINGAISNILTISNVQLTNSGGYTVIVTNPVGSVTSSNAVLTVVIVPPPSFGNIIAARDGSFILSGTGGANNGVYYVLTSSNLLVPLTNWTYTATDHFDSTGGFIFTNAAQTNAPKLFYILRLP